ncbi:MAG: hypothetical protein Q4D57_05985 [Clostridia bacterium]|nr:hypothetical protein [Clostridia bacterium]
MTVKEKAAYIKGLIEGLDLDEDKKETKAISAILDWMESISSSFGNLEEDVDDICEQLSIIDEDLCDVEKEVFGEDDSDECGCCDCDDDDEFYEVKCPTCGKISCFDEDTLCDGQINCPHCGEVLEFDLSDLDGCDCGCDCEPECGCDDDCECGCHCGEEQ